jgi:hypothetical protein
MTEQSRGEVRPSVAVNPMEIDAFLADSVVVAEGKIHALGAGWNVINARGIPTRHDRIGIGFIIRVPYTETNQEHTFELRLEDADGHRLTFGDNPQGEGRVEGFGGRFNVGRPPNLKPGDEQVVPFALNINGLTFENDGNYRFVIAIDGEDTKELPFRVTLIQQPKPIIKTT